MIHIVLSFTYKIHIKNGNTKISVIYLLTNLNITKNFYFLYIDARVQHDLRLAGQFRPEAAAVAAVAAAAAAAVPPPFPLLPELLPPPALFPPPLPYPALLYWTPFWLP